MSPDNTPSKLARQPINWKYPNKKSSSFKLAHTYYNNKIWLKTESNPGLLVDRCHSCWMIYWIWSLLMVTSFLDTDSKTIFRVHNQWPNWQTRFFLNIIFYIYKIFYIILQHDVHIFYIFHYDNTKIHYSWTFRPFLPANLQSTIASCSFLLLDEIRMFHVLWGIFNIYVHV